MCTVPGGLPRNPLLPPGHDLGKIPLPGLPVAGRRDQRRVAEPPRDLVVRVRLHPSPRQLAFGWAGPGPRWG
jgi:hypothetical protein